MRKVFALAIVAMFVFVLSVHNLPNGETIVVNDLAYTVHGSVGMPATIYIGTLQPNSTIELFASGQTDANGYFEFAIDDLANSPLVIWSTSDNCTSNVELVDWFGFMRLDCTQEGI